MLAESTYYTSSEKKLRNNSSQKHQTAQTLSGSFITPATLTGVVCTVQTCHTLGVCVLLCLKARNRAYSNLCWETNAVMWGQEQLGGTPWCKVSYQHNRGSMERLLLNVWYGLAVVRDTHSYQPGSWALLQIIHRFSFHWMLQLGSTPTFLDFLHKAIILCILNTTGYCNLDTLYTWSQQLMSNERMSLNLSQTTCINPVRTQKEKADKISIAQVFISVRVILW